MSSSDRIPMEGVLNCWNDDHDLPDLLLFVCRTKKTGELAFSSPEGDKTLHVRAGRIVFAESSSGDDGLGHFLLRTGKISLMDYLRVSKLVEPGKRLGALLVAEGVMEPSELAPAVLGQVRSIILGLFRRTETWYRFKEGPLSSETITLDLPVESLILDGVRQVESWRRISKGVGHLESRYQAIDDKREEWEGASFPPVVAELFEMLSSPVSVAEICTNATLPDFEACRYLWAFRCLGWVESVDRETKRATAEAEAKAPVARDLVTQTSMKPPSESAPAPARPKPDSKFRRPTLIPQRLIETQVAIEPPKFKPPETSTGNTQRITPAPVLPDLDNAPTDEASAAASRTTEPEDAPSPPPIPEHLTHTNLAVEPPPRPKEDSESQTEPKAAPPAPPPAAPVEPAPPAAARSVVDDLAQTRLDVGPPPPSHEEATARSASDSGSQADENAPSPPSPPPPSIPEELAHTQLAVDPPVETSSQREELTEAKRIAPGLTGVEGDAEAEAKAEAEAEAKAEAGEVGAAVQSEPGTRNHTEPDESAPEPERDEELGPPSMADIASAGPAHTQLFIEPPAPPPPQSTGEMMESILSAQSSPDIRANATGADESSPEPDADEFPEEQETPAGFEALAFDESDPSISSIENLSMPKSEPVQAEETEPPPLPEAGPAPESEPEPDADADADAEPVTAMNFADVDAMESFQDLAYAPDEPSAAPAPPPEPDVEPAPVVEANVVSEPEPAMPVYEAEPDAAAPPPPVDAEPGEPPIVAPPPPPKRKRSPDEGYDLDGDGLAHMITND